MAALPLTKKTVFGATVSTQQSMATPNKPVVSPTVVKTIPVVRKSGGSNSSGATVAAVSSSPEGSYESRNLTAWQRVGAIFNPFDWGPISVNNPFTQKQIVGDVSGFVKPAVIASEVGSLAYGGALASSVGLFTTGNGAVAGGATLRNIGLATGLFGAGVIIGGMSSGSPTASNAPQAITQQPSQPTTGTQNTTTIFNDYSRKNQNTYNAITGSPNSSISSSQSIPTSQSATPIFSQSPYQDTGASQSQQASATGGTNWLAIAAIAAGAYVFLGKR